MWTKITILAIAICMVAANNDEGHFNIKFEKCELVAYNKELLKDVSITCATINETHFKVDGSGYLLSDMNFDEVMATGQVYVYNGQEYAIKPHLKLTLPACEEYTSETFGYWKEIENHGNIKGCGVHKADFYSVKDYVPRMKIKDINIPKEARIMLSVKLLLQKVELLDIHFYVGVQPRS